MRPPSIRPLCCALVVLLGGTATCPAADEPAASPYTVVATALPAAKADGTPAGQTLVKLLVLRSPADRPWEVLTRPYILADDGQRARVEVEDRRAAGAAARPGATTRPAAGSWSGVRADVHRADRNGPVVVVTTVWDAGSIVWSKTDSVKVGETTPMPFTQAELRRLLTDPKR